MAIDLHLHSTASDGLLSPSCLVGYAVDIQLECIALTDHNTLAGLPEAIQRAKNLPIQIIPGIELTSVLQSQELHILAYFIPPDSPIIRDRCARHRQRSIARLGTLIANLRKQGIQVTLEETLAIAAKSQPGRPHLAQAMLNHNIVQSIPEAFEKFIGNHCPAFLPVETESPQQIYSLIHQAGGIGGIAHPGLLNQGAGLATNDLILHKQWGADFVEVYHPAHSEAQTEFYLLQARKNGMAVAGGSDYHGYPTGNQREMAQKICPNWVLRSITQCHQNRQEIRSS